MLSTNTYLFFFFKVKDEKILTYFFFFFFFFIIANFTYEFMGFEPMTLPSTLS